MDKYTGKRLDGRYEIHELLGVGGMAGMYCGARLQKFLSSDILRKLLFVLVLMAAFSLVLRIL